MDQEAEVNYSERQAAEPYIMTVSGQRVTFLNPRPDQIRLSDIAHHLSATCRFNGHVERFYSNAEHCILGARMATTREVSQYFLMHDAAEYVFGDLVSPVKRLCLDYVRLIDNFQDWLNEFFCGSMVVPAEVQEIDSRITATEMKVLRQNKREDYAAEPYEDFSFECWPQSHARCEFIAAFYHYFPEWR